MKNKYFTRQTGIKTIIYPAIPIFVCGLILLPKYPQLFWFIVVYATYVVIVTIDTYVPLQGSAVRVSEREGGSLFRGRLPEACSGEEAR